MRGFRKKVVIGAIVGVSLFSSVAYASYPYSASMDYNCGFNATEGRGRTVSYVQHGSKDWTSYIHYGLNQLINNPAAVSGYWSSTGKPDILITSDYYSDVTWMGYTTALKSLPTKTIKLNSANAETQGFTDWNYNGTATHELTHVWGLNDCEDPNSIDCGYYRTRTVNYITNDVTTLLQARYKY